MPAAPHCSNCSSKRVGLDLAAHFEAGGVLEVVDHLGDVPRCGGLPQLCGSGVRQRVHDIAVEIEIIGVLITTALIFFYK